MNSRGSGISGKLKEKKMAERTCIHPLTNTDGAPLLDGEAHVPFNNWTAIGR